MGKTATKCGKLTQEVENRLISVDILSINHQDKDKITS